jgi:hypothetical protein
MGRGSGLIWIGTRGSVVLACKQWWTLGSIMYTNILTSWETISVSRSTMLHAVSWIQTITRQAMCVKYHRSALAKYYGRGTAARIKQYKCVCILTSTIRHQNWILYAPYYVSIYGLSGCTVFFHIVFKKLIFSWKNECTKCVLILSTTFVWKISHSKNFFV